MLLAAHMGGKRAGQIFPRAFPCGKTGRKDQAARGSASHPADGKSVIGNGALRRSGLRPCRGSSDTKAGCVETDSTCHPGPGGWRMGATMRGSGFFGGETDRKPDVRSDLEDGRRARPGVGRRLRWRRCLAMPRREGVCGQGHRPSDHIGRHGQEACIDDAGGATLIVLGLRQATVLVRSQAQDRQRSIRQRIGGEICRSSRSRLRPMHQTGCHQRDNAKHAHE